MAVLSHETTEMKAYASVAGGNGQADRNGSCGYYWLSTRREAVLSARPFSTSVALMPWALFSERSGWRGGRKRTLVLVCRY